MTFKNGDRIIYTGDFTEELIGQLGTVGTQVDENNVTIYWDTPEAKAVLVDTVMPKSISLISEPSPMEIVDQYHEDKKDLVDKIKSNGGPSEYYDFPGDWKTLNDYIEYKSEHQWGADSFHLANITKAGCRWGDKNGTTKAYDARKIVYSALRILRRLCGKQSVRDFLEELLNDGQFKI